jgi:flagellar biosynthesis chaperone FliJ
MAPKFSFQNVLDNRQGKVKLLEIEFSKLLAAQQEAETRLSSLQEFQCSLLDQLKDAQRSEMDPSKIRLLRLNIVQVNTHIENISLELARLNRAIQRKGLS